MQGCYLPQTDPRGSRFLPCAMAHVSCQTHRGLQNWTEHLGSAVAAGTSPHWTVPAWWSLQLGAIVLAGGFWMLNQTSHFCAHSLSWKRARFPAQSSRIGPLDLKIISVFWLTRFVLKTLSCILLWISFSHAANFARVVGMICTWSWPLYYYQLALICNVRSRWDALKFFRSHPGVLLNCCRPTAYHKPSPPWSRFGTSP